MSVAAMVTLKPGAEPPSGFPPSGYLPVATEAEFTRHWLPLARRAGLGIIAEFGTGIPLGPSDIAEISTELSTFSALVPESLSPPIAARIAERVTLLRELLTILDPDTVEEIYIG